MSNPLFNMLGGNNVQLPGNMGRLVQQFNQFRNSFKGDPRAQIQQMLNSGQISQTQFDQAVQQAQALRKMLGM